MSTKTEIQAQINTIADGGDNPASTVREAMGSRPNSLLENLYATPVVDTSSVTTTITTSNSNFSYSATFLKTGRTINVRGAFTNISGATLSNNETIFDITLPEYQNDFKTRAVGHSLISGQSDSISLYIQTDFSFYSLDAILPAESFQFNFNYNAAN